MDEESRKKVFGQAAGCMENLVSSSGHLTSCSMDWESFEITRIVSLGNGLTEYAFSAMATSQGEFMEDPPEPGGWEPDSGEDIVPEGIQAPPSPGGIDPERMDRAGMEPVRVGPAGGEIVPVSASIVLDAQFKLALDRDGNARLGGYSCLPPAHWHPDFIPGKG